MEFSKLDSNNKVSQSNELITSQYKLTLNEQKIVLCLISLIQPSDKDFQKYRLKVQDLMDLLNISNKHFYIDMKDITASLLKKTLHIKTIEKYIQVNWLSSAVYFNDKWFIEVGIDPELKPYLLNLKKDFLSYNIWITINFKSIYSIRIFQLLLSCYKKSWEKKKNFIFSLEYLRWLFQLEKNTYPLFANFKVKILEKARKEIKEKNNNFYFEYKEVKKWRKVVSIDFTIITSNKKNSHPEKVIDTLIMVDLLKWVPNIDEYIERYGASVVEENFKYFKRQYEKWKIKDKENPATYLIKAIENNYAGNLLPKSILLSKEDLKKNEEEEAFEKEKREKEFKTHLRKTFKSKYHALTQEKKEELEWHFIAHCNSKSHLQSKMKKIKTSWFDDCFWEFFICNRKRVLSDKEMNFELWDSTQTLF